MCLLNFVDFLPISSWISENICQFVCSEVANDCRARSFGQKSLLNQALAAASVVICCVFGCLLVMCSEWKVLPSCRAASFYLRLAPQTRFSRLLNAASLRWFSWFFILGDNSIEMFTSFFSGRFRFFWVLLGEVWELDSSLYHIGRQFHFLRCFWCCLVMQGEILEFNSDQIDQLFDHAKSHPPNYHHLSF